MWGLLAGFARQQPPHITTKRQQIAPKKVYPIDTGLARAIGFTFSPNTGRRLENAAFLALRRRTQEIYYYTTTGGYEVDFYLPDTSELMQVTQNLDMTTTCGREVRAMADAMQALSLSNASILTEANAPAIDEGGLTVEIRSLAEWLLEGG